jgi:DNA primase
MLIANPKEYLKETINLYEYIVDNYPKLVKGKGLLCPFHNDTKIGSFSIYKEDNYDKFKCFSCETSGDIFEFIEKKENLSFNEALELLASKYNVKLRVLSPEEKELLKQKEIVKAINKEATIYYHNELKENKQALEYCYTRGLSDPIINHFKIGLAPSNDKLYKLLSEKYSKSDIENTKLFNDKGNMFYNRIMFPLVNDKGEVISFSGRIYLPHDLKNENIAKYKNGHETIVFKKSDLLFGINYAKNPIKEKDFVIITEGYMDTIKLHINGFYNSVACMSANITDNQINKLLKITKNFIIALDNDDAGIKGVKQFWEKVKRNKNINVKILCLPDKYKDIDLYFEDGNIKEYFQKLIENTLKPDYFLIKLLIKNWSFKSDKQIDVTKEIKDYWKSLDYVIKKDIYIKIIEPTIISKILFPSPKEVERIKKESQWNFNITINKNDQIKNVDKEYEETPDNYVKRVSDTDGLPKITPVLNEIKKGIKIIENISSDNTDLNTTIDTKLEIKTLFFAYHLEDDLLSYSVSNKVYNIKDLHYYKQYDLKIWANDNFDNIYSIVRNIYKLKDDKLLKLIKLTRNEYFYFQMFEDLRNEKDPDKYNKYPYRSETNEYMFYLYSCLYNCFNSILNKKIAITNKEQL